MKERKISSSGKEFDQTPITTYFQFEPAKTAHEKVKVLKKGQEIRGEYQHTFINEEFDTQTHLFKLDTGEKVTVRGCTSLNTALDTLSKGANVRLVFLGKGKAKPGRRPPWIFDVFETVSDDAEDAPVTTKAQKSKAAPAPEVEEDLADDEELDEPLPF